MSIANYVMRVKKPFRIERANLQDVEERKRLSVQLQEMETAFTYPLGDAEFTIRHGGEGVDYFTFFEQFGTPHVFLVYCAQTEALIGVGCAVLRILNGVAVWYLGDFKLKKAYRGQGILKQILLKYFLRMYFKANKMIAVNMSAPEGNGLIRKIKSLFSIFSLSVVPLYFYEWAPADVPVALRAHVVLHNHLRKDIVIAGSTYPLFHLCDPTHYVKHLQTVQTVSWDQLPADAVLMYCGKATEAQGLGLTLDQANTVGSLVQYGVSTRHFCSAEI